MDLVIGLYLINIYIIIYEPLISVVDPARHNNTLPSNISSSSVNGGSTNKNNLLTVNNTSGSSLGRSGLLHATSNGSWASSGNHR